MAAAFGEQDYTATKLGYTRDDTANRQRVKNTPALRHWFFHEAQGGVVQLKHGPRVTPLDADTNSFISQSLEDAFAVLDT